MLSAISCPFLVNLINFVLPFFSKRTRPSFSRHCRIFTAWLYVQSTSFARRLPYLARVMRLSATSIKAGFLRKKMSKVSWCIDGSIVIYMIQTIYLIRYVTFKLFPSFVISGSNKNELSSLQLSTVNLPWRRVTLFKGCYQMMASQNQMEQVQGIPASPHGFYKVHNQSSEEASQQAFQILLHTMFDYL